MAVTVLAPEYITWLSLEQWRSAGRYKTIQACNVAFWTRNHGFYADMGGLTVKMSMIPRTSETIPEKAEGAPQRGIDYRIDVTDLLVLLRENVIELPAMPLEDIKERSKQDNFANVIMYFQVSVFVTIALGRGVQGLPVSPLELTTIAFICCAAGVEFFWWKKPLDIRSHTSVTISLDGESQFLTVFPELLFAPSEQEKAELIDPKLFFGRFVEDTNEMHKKGIASLVTIGCIFGGIHLLAWNFSFPTEIERWLWRFFGISASSSLVCMYTTLWFCRNKTARWTIVTCGGVLYSLSRTFLVVEAFVALRFVPIRLYETVSWEGTLPHF